MKRNRPLPSYAILREYLRYSEETGELFWAKQLGACRIGSKAGYYDSQGRGTIRLFTFSYPTSRVVWAMMTGKDPKFEIDHIDGNPANDRFENLRDVPHKENMQNRTKPSKRSSSGYLGVFPTRNPNKWCASIHSEGKKHHVGVFDCPKKAHEAYLAAKRKLHLGCTI